MFNHIARAFLAVSMVATVFGTSAQAAWPERPVKLIVPYAPGGASDVLARPWSDALSKSYGHPFVIENRGGASGTIGAEAAARSAADGYTFLLTPNSALTQVPQLRKVGYDPNKDFVPVARVGDLVCGFTVLATLPINNLADLVSYAKANPGKLAYGSSGLGTSNQMRLEMLKLRTGADILHVPYRGSADALTDLLAGQVHIMNEINVVPHIRAGKLRLIAMNYPSRHPDFPDVPTMTEQGYPDSDVPIFYSLFAPTGVSADIVANLNAKVVSIAKTPEMIARMREINVAVPIQTPSDVAAAVAADYVAVGKLIKDANIKLE